MIYWSHLSYFRHCSLTFVGMLAYTVEHSYILHDKKAAVKVGDKA